MTRARRRALQVAINAPDELFDSTRCAATRRAVAGDVPFQLDGRFGRNGRFVRSRGDRRAACAGTCSAEIGAGGCTVVSGVSRAAVVAGARRRRGVALSTGTASAAATTGGYRQTQGANKRGDPSHTGVLREEDWEERILRAERPKTGDQRRTNRAADNTEATKAGQDQFAAAWRAIEWPAGKKAAIFEPAAVCRGCGDRRPSRPFS